jgi:SAM-dependent methyltransferase
MLRILNKIRYLEIILFVLLLSLIYVFLCKKKYEGFIEEKKKFLRYTDKDIYDSFYANVYDKILYNKDKNDFEINYIFPNPIKNSMVLDIGCGTGHHIKKLDDLNITAIGIDNSPAMIKKAKKNYPDLTFKLANIMKTLEFPENTFSHILCLYFTIYYIKDKRTFLENCYQWLKPKGILVIHLVNINKFNPIVPHATSFNEKSKRPTKSVITFDQFTYNSDFQQDRSINQDSVNLKQPNVVFKEVFKFNNENKTRINAHKLYMSSQNSILATAKELGFILKSYTEMNSIDTYEYNYLYTLQKPI